MSDKELHKNKQEDSIGLTGKEISSLKKEISGYKIKDPTEFIESIKIKGTKRELREFNEVKKSAISFLFRAQLSLVGNSRPNPENEFIYGQMLSKTVSLLSIRGLKNENITKEFENITESVITDTRKSLTSLKNSFNPVDITNFANILSFISGLGFALLTPENAEASDFGLKSKQKLKNETVSMISTAGTLGLIAYYLNRKDVAKAIDIARQGGLVLKRI